MFDTVYNTFRGFYDNPVIRRLATEKRWTISDSNKVPIDMSYLLSSNGMVIRGAKSTEEHCPYMDLWNLLKHIPNAANHAFYLDAMTDGVMVLDIEPKCPKEIAEKLLQLPAYYGEYSMSGKGYHLILPVPNTYQEVFSCVNAVKEEHGYYEFLCNHYVTFTRNVLPAGLVPNMGQASYDDFITTWNAVAVNVDLDKKKSLEAILEEEEETEYSDYIQSVLQSADCAYKKEPADFFDDMSRYEFGYTSHIYFQLMKVLRKIKVFYTLNEVIWEVYRATSALIDYRDKHDTFRNNKPWLLYLSSEIACNQYSEEKMHQMTDETSAKENTQSLESAIDDNDEENVGEIDYYEDSSAYNPEDYLYDDSDIEIEDETVTTDITDEIDFSEFETASAYNSEFEDY